MAKMIITEAEAIRRTKQLLASCEPKAAETAFIHRLFEFFTLSVDKGYPFFLQHLVNCYTDKNGTDIGKQPDTYENCGWMYLQTLIANLEEKLEQNRIAEQVKEDVRQMLSQATSCADLADAFLKIQALAESQIGATSLMLPHCFAWEIQKSVKSPGVLAQIQKCASGADKGATLSDRKLDGKGTARPDKGKPERKPRTEWTLQAQEKVAAIWVAWRRNHNTLKRRGREIDCFEKHKTTLPECIKTVKDFHNCKECARKHGLIPKYNRKRRKSAG